MAGAFDLRREQQLAGLRPAIGAFAPSEGVPDLGFGPMTPSTMAGMPNGEISSAGPTGLETALEYGSMPAKAFIGQAENAGQSWYDAVQDPSLANMTNAGVQTGLAFGSPAMVGLSAAGGFGAAAADDLDLFEPRSARADGLADMVKGDPELELLYQQVLENDRLSKADVPKRSKAESAAIRAQYSQKAADAQKALQDAMAARTARTADKGRADYDAAVNTATVARDRELARDRRFSETEVGKVYDKLGGLAPVAAGMGYGAMARLAAGPAKTIPSELGRLAGGSAAGVTAIHAPLAYNSFSTEVDNPERRAYQEYAYNLPEGHPDKAKAQARADAAPVMNPIRETAQKELYDPVKLAERLLFGTIEGAGGAEMGGLFPGASLAMGKGALKVPGAIAETAGSLPRSFMSGVRGPQAPAPTPSATPLVSVDDAARFGGAFSGPKQIQMTREKPMMFSGVPSRDLSPSVTFGRAQDIAPTQSWPRPKALSASDVPSAPTAAPVDRKQFISARSKMWRKASRQAESATTKEEAIAAIQAIKPGKGYPTAKAAAAKRRMVQEIKSSRSTTGEGWAKKLQSLRRTMKANKTYGVGAGAVGAGLAAQSEDGNDG